MIDDESGTIMTQFTAFPGLQSLMHRIRYVLKASGCDLSISQYWGYQCRLHTSG